MPRIRAALLLIGLSMLGLENCTTQPSATEVVPAATALPPSVTPAPAATATLVPTPTAIPGSLVLPVDSLGPAIPWLPLDKTNIPAVYFFYFNLDSPPFNNVLVRQAFAAAIDREALTQIAQKYGNSSAKPATTLTPPETLGRDLYNQTGIPFNPQRAQELLIEAGYTDPSKFPTTVLLTNVAGDPAPAAHQKIADAMLQMWQQNLGVKVTMQVLSWGPYLNRIASSPTQVFRLGWVADYNDPDNFLRELFRTGGKENYGHFSDSTFDRLVDRAKASNDPALRQLLYIQAEKILSEEEAAIIPIYHWSFH